MNIGFDELDLYSIKINSPEFDEKRNIYISKIYYSENGKLTNFVFNTPIMRIVKVDYYNENYFMIEVEFPLTEPSFYDFFYLIDIMIRDNILLNGEEWFGAKLNFDTLDNLFKKTIKIPKKITLLPTIEFFIPTKFNNKNLIPNCILVDDNNNKVNLDELKEGNQISFRLNLNNINFFASKYTLCYLCEKIILSNNNYEKHNDNDYIIDTSSSESLGSLSESDYIAKNFK
jgi:hypothetical protein